MENYFTEKELEEFKKKYTKQYLINFKILKNKKAINDDEIVDTQYFHVPFISVYTTPMIGNYNEK